MGSAFKLHEVYYNCYNLQVELFHPQSKLQWKRCVNMPVKVYNAQAVAIGDKVYVGGGENKDHFDRNIVLEYNTVKGKWTCLPEHYVSSFCLCQFQRELFTVGGAAGGSASNKVYRYSTADRKWVESLKPMPTKRAYTAVLTTASAIIVCGGIAEILENGQPATLATVEVYSSTTSQWHTADPLPQPCAIMSSTTINGSGYILGPGSGVNREPLRATFCVDMATLIDRATSLTRHRLTTSTWKTLPDTPLAASTAATLSGGLLAAGGIHSNKQTQSTVHVFVPFTNSWVKLPFGNLPVARYFATTVQLSSNQMMVMGGVNSVYKATSTCYIGSVV